MENLAVYSTLYEIETALRELILESLGALAGPLWYKHRLPGDVLDSCRRGIRDERATNWTQLVPHHSIYYVEFPDLKKILAREDNWKDAFEPIFHRKDILQNTLSELEPIRNKIAHNRRATSEDVRITASAYTKLTTAVGRDRFQALVARCSRAEDIRAQLIALQREAVQSCVAALRLDSIASLPAWTSIKAAWWFDETYLCAGVSKISNFFSTMHAYSTLPRKRGQGHAIEQWVRSQSIEQKFADANNEFAVLLGLFRGGTTA